MVTIPLGVGDWESPSENISRLRLHNMYLTDNPQSPDGISRVSRPTLTELTTIGDGPIYGIWRQDATFDGDWFIVSGEEFYRYDPVTEEAELLGELAGTDYCQFAGIAEKVVVVRGGVAYAYNGTTLTVIELPDDVPPYEGVPAPVGSVACIDSIFILTVQGGQRFYWIFPTETDPDPLNFASAERIPDSIESVNILMDEVWFLGSEGPEVWQTAQDIDLPFQRINGRVYNEGCISRDTVVQSVNESLPCLIWVTQTGSVAMAQGSSVGIISSESVEEKLKVATNLRAYGFRKNRHDFYVLTGDDFTYVYDITRKEWSRWSTYLQDYWYAHLGLMVDSVVYTGSAVDNKIWKLEEGYTDDGLPVVREVSGVVLNNGKAMKCSVVYVRVNSGWAPDYNIEPQLELRWSDDQGSSWSNYISISMGRKGQYKTDTIFRSLGLIERPGRNFEIRFSSPATIRIDCAVMNED